MTGEVTAISFGPAGLVVIGLYVLSMLGVGWLGRRFRRGDDLADFYLAGRSMGLAVLFLTLYATQYSGNTLFGYPGRTYRVGFDWLVSVLFMFSIVVGYLSYAPRLVVLARRYAFITPADYIAFRYGSPALTAVTSLLMIYALANFTLAQLKAMGAAVEGISAGAIPASFGVIGLALIMVIYETLGGMRSVAWTDALQGVVLIAGFFILLFVIPDLGGGLPAIVAHIGETEPDKLAAPDRQATNTWLSFLVLLGVGASLYPQAIQRLYAARSLRVLKRSLSMMAFMPLFTTLIALVCGLTAIVVLPGLEGTDTDQALPRLLALVMERSLFGYWLVVAVFAAVLAALMSTADSALLSISSMIVKDFYGPMRGISQDDPALARVGKIASWIVVALLVVIAIRTDQTLVRLLEIKFELLIQIAPGFILGFYVRRLTAAIILSGIAAGLAVSLLLTFSGFPLLYGFHAGTVGLGANLVVCGLGLLLTRSSAPARNPHSSG